MADVPNSPSGASLHHSDNSIDHDDAGAQLQQPLSKATTVGDETSSEERARMDNVLQSEIGLTTLLSRLKQSLASVKDFSTFLRKRSAHEEDHSATLKKLARHLQESARRPNSRQGTLLIANEEFSRIHERMSEHGYQFAHILHQMSDELNELASSSEKGRKQWKTTGMTAEKRAIDAAIAAEKASARYHASAEQYHRLRTGDPQKGVKFGLKKTTVQHEEELLKKVQAQDMDYHAKVTAAKDARERLVTHDRPEAIRALQELIVETDVGLSLQMQKFALYSEKLTLGVGLSVHPMKKDQSETTAVPPAVSLRDSAYAIDTDKDLKNYVLQHLSRVPPPPTRIKYEVHPALHPNPNAPKEEDTAAPPTQDRSGSAPTLDPLPFDPIRPSTSHSSASVPPIPPTHGQQVDYSQPAPYGQPVYKTPSGNETSLPLDTPLPPIKPVFGVSLGDLFERDQTMVPLIVAKCIAAVETFALNMEGLYRVNGSTTNIARLKMLFDHDAERVDLLNPETFMYDINAVCSLLKQFFRELPIPLFTQDQYGKFIAAAKIPNDLECRQALHREVNELPNANYATLRFLILHLNRVQENSDKNRMEISNIALSFGPSLMGVDNPLGDNEFQIRALMMILANTYVFFDDYP